MKIQSYDHALSYIYSHIPTSPQTEFPGERGIKRMRALLEKLDNPQEQLRVIHIAGTSGKGSTAYILSQLLRSQEYSVGLHLSPHILDIRERCQINGIYLSKAKFVQYLNEIVQSVDSFQNSVYGPITYFEILVALAYYSFAQEKVDYAVIETGLGGLYDGTNVVHNQNKICLITQIGLDHTKVLGESIEDIARQKAGIIQKGNRVVSGSQEKSVEKVFSEVALKKNATLSVFRKDSTVCDIQLSETKTSFTFSYSDIHKNVELSLLGYHQAQNAALALAGLYEVSHVYAVSIDWGSVQRCLRTLYIPARMDVIAINNKKLIIDGAHNPQKMESFLKSLTHIFGLDKKVFLIAFKTGKDTEQMLRMIAPHASQIILTSFELHNQDMPHFSQSPEELKQMLLQQGYNSVVVVPSSQQGLELALGTTGEEVVITGSLYFASVLYQLLDRYKK